MEAYKWFSLPDSPKARAQRDHISGETDEEQIAKAKRFSQIGFQVNVRERSDKTLKDGLVSDEVKERSSKVLSLLNQL